MNFPSLNGNWIDLVIFIILAFFIFEALNLGFWIIVSDFLSFVFSLFFALFAYSFIASLISVNFSLARSLSNALAFLIAALIAESIISLILGKLVSKLPIRYWKKWWLKFVAIVPALGEGLILSSFLLMLTISFPVSTAIKDDISSSRIGGMLIKQTSAIEGKINDVFGGVINDTLTYLTVERESSETISLYSRAIELSVDMQAETSLFNLVNSERMKRGLSELTWREELLPIARGHASDMWERSYFGHYSPEGENIADRLEKYSIPFSAVGENLALAPTVITAHDGLMNSEGHRENILDIEFRRGVIGVVDNGAYGKIFVQIFTN